MISSHSFIGFVAVVAGFYGGCLWVDASASLELSQTRNEVSKLQKEIVTHTQTIDKLKAVNNKREKMVQEFSKTYEATK